VTLSPIYADWTGDDGAYLELGEVNDTFHVRVNGELLPPCDPMDAVVDLGRRLVPGVNQIDVEVASTLINRLRVVTPSVYGVATRQNYGLVGPVRGLRGGTGEQPGRTGQTTDDEQAQTPPAPTPLRPLDVRRQGRGDIGGGKRRRRRGAPQALHRQPRH